MIVKKTKRVRCKECKKRFTIRQYKGTGNSWWTDHYPCSTRTSDMQSAGKYEGSRVECQE